MVAAGSMDPDNTDSTTVVVLGSALLLIGVPVMLPWLVERVSGRIRGGAPSWQLAIRRLQLDSGTSARVVGGIAVVLTGAIALLTVLTVVADQARAEAPGSPSSTLLASVDAKVLDDVLARLATTPAVGEVRATRLVEAYPAGSGQSSPDSVLVADCAVITRLTTTRECTDGQAFAVAGTVLRPGSPAEFRHSRGDRSDFEVVGTWTVPDRLDQTELAPPASGTAAGSGPASSSRATIIATPGAIPDLPADVGATVQAQVDRPTADQLEQIRNAFAAHPWQTFVYPGGPFERIVEQQSMGALQDALYTGSTVTLLVAGLSLLVLAFEQIQERRKPLAMLVASGVGLGVLARSLLWQVAVPIVLGVAVAVLTGLGMATLVLRMLDLPLTVDWPSVAALSGGAALVTLAVTAMTLPFLRGVTKVTSLRAE